MKLPHDHQCVQEQKQLKRWCGGDSNPPTKNNSRSMSSVQECSMTTKILIVNALDVDESQKHMRSQQTDLCGCSKTIKQLHHASTAACRCNIIVHLRLTTTRCRGRP